ncbi:dipeptidyl aminopeptidase/acylaminoacyl-peptidase-like protein [Oleiphilus messinensis]|uniref:Dipeptidyl aminopeptidase/acylaminoacyl-peptidase-like protein n=1 Tax=Oleiphilus messinensis TaxID=141451 RepID=A0A1Y0I7A9_9GAMM|nr:alpha/beta fold hydrolase [Oleiphilus messinensis]ARU55395.1 dipeptidyl aminopeptidase/acylaminoacyl-peptidase-like protein [Oleiphilus messinensis]
MSFKYTLYRYFKKPFFGRFNRPWRWPEGIDQNLWHRLDVPSRSGSMLSALVAESPNLLTKGAVLLVHPMGAIAKGFWMKHGHADLLLNAGYHVMVFDLNGFGESTNATMDYPLDVLAAGLALQGRYPELPIAVMGSSMGAAMSICALAEPDHPFRAAVFESAFPTLLHFWRRFPIPKLGIQMSKFVYPAGERRLRPTYAVDSWIDAPPVLLIYGDADQFTPVEDGELLKDCMNRKTNTTFWCVPDVEHTQAYKAQPQAYADRVLSFLSSRMSQVKPKSKSCSSVVLMD